MLGCGEVRGDEGNEVREEMWGSVLGLHTPTHFPTPPPFLSPHANTLPHSPHTLSYNPPYTSPLPTHLSLPPNTLPYTSPHTSCLSSPHLPLHPNTLPHSPHALFHTSSHIFPHSFDDVAKLPCDDVTLINLTGKAR